MTHNLSQTIHFPLFRIKQGQSELKLYQAYSFDLKYISRHQTRSFSYCLQESSPSLQGHLSACASWSSGQSSSAAFTVQDVSSPRAGTILSWQNLPVIRYQAKLDSYRCGCKIIGFGSILKENRKSVIVSMPIKVVRRLNIRGVNRSDLHKFKLKRMKLSERRREMDIERQASDDDILKDTIQEEWDPPRKAQTWHPQKQSYLHLQLRF